MTFPTINEQWREFERRVLQGAGPIQRREMKRAFFAGFDQALTTLSQLSTEPEDVAVERLDRYHTEVRGFSEAIKLGAA